MAIQDSFNLSKATTSQAYAYKCWYNYNYGGNTMKISSKDMGEITQTWNGELKNWRATASNDENAYEIEDDDYSTAKLNGKESAKDKTGYDGGKGGMIAGGVGDALGSAVGAVATGAATGAIRGWVGGVANTAGGAIKNASKSVLGKNSVKAGKKEAKGSAYLVATLAIATALKYRLSKPNKEQKKACDELQNTMQDAKASLAAAQDDMTTAGDEIVDFSDQAQVYNEDANDEIEDKKTEYDMYKVSYDALMEKVKSGESLTEDEKALMKELVPMMQQLGVDIGDLSDETTDNVAEIYDKMGTYQDTYDNAAETMAEVEGVTDYAENFDEATRTMCYVEGFAQGLNAASGATAGAKLMAGGWWNWALGIASIAAGASSGFASAEQFDWAGKVGNEINARKETQDLNATTTDMYDENIDAYAGQMEGVEDLELEIPEDMSDPEGMAEQLGEESSAVLAQNTTPDGTTGAVVTGGTNTFATTTSTKAPDDKDKDKNKA